MNNLLHPRTTGFTYIVQTMRESKLTKKLILIFTPLICNFFTDGGLHAIYDVTIGYPDKIPETEQDIIDGNLPNEIHFHIKR